MKRLCSAVVLSAVAVVAPLAQVAGPVRAPVPSTPAGVTVSGRVVEIYPGVAPDKLPGEVLLAIDAERAGRIGPFTLATVNPDGTFTFEGITPGVYTVSSRVGPGLPKVPIEVGATPIRDIRVPFTSIIPVTFSLSMDDGTPLPTGNGYYSLTTARAGEATRSFTTIDPSRPKAEAFIPGEYYVFVTPPAGLHLKSLGTPTIDLRRGSFTLAPGSDGLAIAGVISRTAPADTPLARLRGHITGNHGGFEIGLADVTAFGTPMRNPSMYTTATADGTFEFANLPPGVYGIDVPPARSVKEAIVVAGNDVDVELAVPEGQIVTGTINGYADVGGRRRPTQTGAITLTFSGPVVRTRRMVNPLFWDALPPGEYRVTVDGLDAGVSLELLRAGSTDLLTRPYVVPAHRPPEAISILLRAPAD